MSRPLDAAWQAWLQENLARGCDVHELVGILLEQRFALESIRDSMGERFPDASAAAGGAGRPLDPSWQTWVRENLDRQCDPSELVAILLRHKFALDSIQRSLGERFPSDTPDYAALSLPRLTRRGGSDPSTKRVESDKLQLYVINDFMTGAQCDTVAELIDRNLRPSTVTRPDNDRYFRTSRTCDLSLLEAPLVAALDESIAATLGIRAPYSEGIQGQRYDAGQEFKPHTDFFEPGTEEYREHAATRGNRTWTVMVYLNEGMAGGGTRFAAIDRVFQPRKGQALAWNNLYPDGRPNYDTLHSGMPVEQGCKLVITKWFREKGRGPMFYDEN